VGRVLFERTSAIPLLHDACTGQQSTARRRTTSP
jgi:hypothetical protein